MQYYRLCITIAGEIADYATGYREYIRGCQVQAIVRKGEFVILDQRLYGQRLRSERISQFTCRTSGQLDFLIKPERYFPCRRDTRRIIHRIGIEQLRRLMIVREDGNVLEIIVGMRGIGSITLYQHADDDPRLIIRVQCIFGIIELFPVIAASVILQPAPSSTAVG